MQVVKVQFHQRMVPGVVNQCSVHHIVNPFLVFTSIPCMRDQHFSFPENLKYLQTIQSTVQVESILYPISISSRQMPKFAIIALLLLSLMGVSQQFSCLPGCTSCTTPYNCNVCQPAMSCCASTCTSCANQITCAQCASGYTLNLTANLCFMSNSCLQMNCNGCSSQQTCTSCAAGYFLDQYTYKCGACPTACVSCSSSTNCTSCAGGYYINGTGCSACNANCYQCASSAVCTTCVQGWVANQGICQQCVPNCQICTTTTTCSTCNQGYYINSNNQCSACNQNCRACSAASNNCSSCLPGFNLVNNACINCAAVVPGCTTCAQEGTTLMCYACSPGYYVLKASSCEPCMSYCQKCNSTACFQCSTGYYYNNATSTCIQCPQLGCLSCNNAVCTNCVLGTFLSPTTATCELCSQGCDLCSSLSFCLECSDNYFNQNGVCRPCDIQCDQCSSTAYNCQSCKVGFYQPSGSGFCLPCPSYCPNCTDALTCASCPYGSYMTSQGNCTKCSLTNCVSCDTVGTNICTLCNIGYYLGNNFCNPCIANCAVCTNGQQCQQCYNGYYWNTNTNTCVPCSGNCSVCQGVNNCSQCIQGYYVRGAMCYKCPTQCINCNQVDQCLQCAVGYYLQQINGVSSGQCSACSPPCLTCTSNSTTCTSCKTGYQVDDVSFQCVACQNGCLTCNTVLGCLACRPGFVKARNTSATQETYYCISCPKNCNTCIVNAETHPVSTKCTSCYSGYKELTSGTCYACGSTPATFGCKTCTELMTCQVCVDGLVLNSSNQCIAETIDDSSSTGFYITICVFLSAAITGLGGLIAYNQYKASISRAQGLYNAIV